MDRKTNLQEKKVEKKVKLPFILLCVAGGLLAGIIICYPIFRIVSFLFTFGSDYTDTNGPDNFSLEVLGEDDVLGEHESKMIMSGVFFEGESTNVKGLLEDYDRDICSVQADIFDGVCTAQATKIDKDRLTLKMSSQVYSGNFEIFVLVENEISHRIEANCEKEIVLEGIKEKTVLVNIVGEGADFAFTVERIY